MEFTSQRDFWLVMFQSSSFASWLLLSWKVVVVVVVVAERLISCSMDAIATMWDSVTGQLGLGLHALLKENKLRGSIVPCITFQYRCKLVKDDSSHRVTACCMQVLTINELASSSVASSTVVLEHAPPPDSRTFPLAITSHMPFKI
eukprot:2272738-Amphidinium_carterae.1